MGQPKDVSGEQLELIFQGLGISEKSVESDTILIKEWYDKQVHLPEIPPEFEDDFKMWIRSLLIATKNSIERVKISVENYMYLRTDFPAMFDDKLIKETMYNKFYDTVTAITLPKLTEDYRMIFYWCFNSPDPSTFDFIYMVQRFRVVLDYHIKEGTKFFGFHSILDLTNFKLAHLSQLDIMLLKKIMNYSDKAYPLRICHLHIINPPSFIEYAFNVVRPFCSKKIMARVLVHKSVHGLQNYISPEILPKELGGTEGSLSDILTDWHKRVATSTRLLNSDTLVVDKSLKASPSKGIKANGVNDEDVFGQDGSFRKLCVD